MGSLLAAPISALASCVGGCTAVCCCKALECGSVTTSRGASILLLLLQTFALLLTILLSLRPESWLQGPCEALGDVGVCECSGSLREHECYVRQLTYRSEAAAAVLFVIMLLMELICCTSDTARSYVALKFVSIVALLAVFLFIPNVVFSCFGDVASAASAVFLVAQAVLIIDFAYTWNEQWYVRALESSRARVESIGGSVWQRAILGFAASFIIIAAVGASLIFVKYPSQVTNAVLIPALVCSFLLLLVSITTWCEHGALLPSAVFMAYSVWLAFEALSIAHHEQIGSPMWLRLIELLTCLATMVAVASGVGATWVAHGSSRTTEASQLEAGQAAAETGEVQAGKVESKVFATQCSVHVFAALYVCAVMAPAPTNVTFGFRTAALVIAMLAYGWSLIAPKVLTNRIFV